MDFINGLFEDLDLKYLMIVAAVFAMLPVIIFASNLSLNKKKVKRYNSQLRAKEEPMQTKWSKMQPRLSYALSDKRALFTKKAEDVDIDDEPKKPLLSRRVFLILLFVVSFVSPFALLYLGFYIYGLIAPLVLFFSAITFGLKSPVAIMQKREKMYKNMYQIIQSTIGVEKEMAGDYNAVIKVKKWAADGLTPLRIDIAVPPTFNAAGELGFIEQFNQVYGTSNAWVARSAEEGVPGWDYENNVVHMYSVPPIPQSAPWSERYVLDPGISWSFFPLGLAAENGVEMKNPETGKNEYVIGFDVAGEQAKYSKKAGYAMGSEIVTSPMLLIAGGTGSGKALSSDTPVKKALLPADIQNDK